MKRGISNLVIQRIEALEGCSVKAALQELYVEKKLSYRKLCARWAMQNKQIIKLMVECGIAPRKGSEAVKTQWEDNDERRAATAQRTGVWASSLAAAGKHARQGKKLVDNPSWQAGENKRQAAAFKPEVRKQQGATRQRLFAAHPEMHPNAKAAPTRCEAIMLSWCQELGYVTEFNKLQRPYWIDVYLPELNIGIECVSDSRRPTWERHMHLVSTGIHMLYIPNSFIDKGDAHLLLAYLTAYSSDIGQYQNQATVIGWKGWSFFTNQPAEVLIKTFALDGGACLQMAPAD
jgi:hypothetical protein